MLLDLAQALPSGRPRLPSDLTLRPYQEQAIANWFAASGRGTLKMATGSGKTITALALASRLLIKPLASRCCSLSVPTAIW